MGVRFYQIGDKEQINKLFKKVFNESRSSNTWTWKYIAHPHADNPWILIYEEEGVILGHIALWVSYAFINGETKKIGLRIDTMVDPDERGKGIYFKLNEQMLKEATNSGITYLYGFPAAKAKDLLIKYTTGIHVADITRYTYLLKPTVLVAAKLPLIPSMPFLDRVYMRLKKKRFSNLADVTIEEVTFCDERFDQLAEQTKNLKQILIKRDAMYLNWRYHNHPENQYRMIAAVSNNEIIGYAVVRDEVRQLKKGKEITFGFLVDWFAIDDQLLTYIVSQAIQYLSHTDIIQAWSLANNMSEHSLEAAGFVRKDQPMPFIIHDLSRGDELLQSEQSWLITQGDVDSF